MMPQIERDKSDQMGKTTVPMITTELTPKTCAAELMNVIPLVVRFIRAEMRHHGQPLLSLSQLRVLHFLKRRPNASLSEVADYLDVSRATMSTMIERLVQRGLVDRTDDPEERRRLMLSLTEAGLQQCEQVYQATLDRLSEMLTPLSEKQLQQMMQGLALLEETFVESKDL